MSAVPTDLKYSMTHEWFRVEGDVVTIGITQFAANELTDITFVDLPAVGSTISAGTCFGEIESVKATSELFSAVGGEVVETNEALVDQPELVNSEPFTAGWMVKVRASSLSPLETMLDPQAYEEILAQA